MSVDKTQFELDPEVRAALVWDVKRLQAGSPSARNLAAAFSPPPWNFDEEASGPLQAAAQGVMAVGRGDLEDALTHWSQLADSRDEGERLLGLMLRLWVRLRSEERSRDLRAALELVATLQPLEDRSRLDRKIAAAAMDSGDYELAREAAMRALDAAAPSSDLQRAAQALLWHLGDRGRGAVLFGGFEDDLLTQPWITEQALAGATDADLTEFKDEIAGVWGGSLRFGRTPVDVLNAAQRQADWAGLPARRDSLLTLMCSHILRDRASSDANVRWATSAWILAGGQNVRDVLRYAEPQLDSDFAHALIETLGESPNGAGRLPVVAGGIWHLVSPEDANLLLTRLDPGTLNQPSAPEARNVWANLLWLDPNGWLEHWRELDQARQLAALSEVAIEATTLFDARAARQLLTVCDEAAAEIRPQVAGIAAALAVTHHSDPQRWIDAARPSTILDLARWNREVVSETTLRSTVQALYVSVEGRRESARGGTFSLGGGSTVVLLAQAVAMLAEPDIEAQDLLLELAGDQGMSLDDQIAALQGLGSLNERDLLSDAGKETLHAMALPTGRQVWGSIEPGALRAAQLYAFGGDLNHDERAELFAGCRASSGQVRLLSVAALEAVLERSNGDQGASWTLLSSMYDPSDEVLTRALGVLIRAGRFLANDVYQATSQAVAAAYRTGRRTVRLTATEAAASIAARSPAARTVLDAARQDPSWEVRRLADDLEPRNY